MKANKESRSMHNSTGEVKIGPSNKAEAYTGTQSIDINIQKGNGQNILKDLPFTLYTSDRKRKSLTL